MNCEIKKIEWGYMKIQETNVERVWNNLSFGKKIGFVMLLVFLWLLYLDEWLGIGDIIDGLL